MRSSRFNDEQIIGTIKELESEVSTIEAWRHEGILRLKARTVGSLRSPPRSPFTTSPIWR